MNYRDRTYCAGPCAAEDCSRQITAEVTDAANRAGLPLSISDFRSACPDFRPTARCEKPPAVCEGFVGDGPCDLCARSPGEGGRR
jgi:hypothetical protein